MITPNSPIYRKAFVNYLRRGTPIDVFLKAQAASHPTPLYRWHTMGDDKVRPEHAANEGKIFAWAHPPETGNPGDAINCRCSAEAVEVDTTPLEILALLSGAGFVRRVGVRVVREVVRRVGRENEAPPPKPAEPPPLPKPQGIPKNWEKISSKKGDGVKYVDPKNSGNDVRVQKGDPNSIYKNSQKDYVRWKKEGKLLEKNGNPSTDPEKTHIPLEEFKFDPEIFK